MGFWIYHFYSDKKFKAQLSFKFTMKDDRIKRLRRRIQTIDLSIFLDATALKLRFVFAHTTKNESFFWSLYSRLKSIYALSINYMAKVTAFISSSAFTSWYLPSVICMNVWILPYWLNTVGILIAPREYFPLAQSIKTILTEIVVESIAKMSLSISLIAYGSSAYNVPARFIRYIPKSAKMRQSLFSFVREKVNWSTLCLIPQ